MTAIVRCLVSAVFLNILLRTNLTHNAQLDQRIPQVRGEFKVAACAMVVRGFNLSGLTPAVKAAKVMTLIGEHMFQLHYEHIDEVSHFALYLYA